MSPIGRWLREYVEEHDTSLAALSRDAGLSPSALRYLVLEPHRTPTLETCLKLAHATNTPIEDLTTLANLPEASPEQDQLQPGRWELIKIFDALPPEGRQMLVGIARVFEQSDTTPKRAPWLISK
jgi:transcriptional regulator with XRE-family HTH domain